jgi:hypothetical protein
MSAIAIFRQWSFVAGHRQKIATITNTTNTKIAPQRTAMTESSSLDFYLGPENFRKNASRLVEGGTGAMSS